MKKFAPFAILLWFFTLAGCVQMHMETVIEKDGSGTFAMSYSMSESVAEAIKELKDMDMPGQNMDDAPSLDDFNQEEIEKACKESGVKLQKFERSTLDGKENLEMVIAFKHINDLSDALTSTMNEQGGGFKIFKTSDGNYNLVAVEPEAQQSEPEEEESPSESPQSMEDMDPEMMGKSMEIMGKLMGSMSELDIGMRVTVPGEILRHNAQRVEGNTLIWEINSSNMMSGDAGSMEPDIVFSGKGVKIDAPLLTE